MTAVLLRTYIFQNFDLFMEHLEELWRFLFALEFLFPFKQMVNFLS